MVIFHSYVSLPEGTHLTHSENISKHQQTWHLQVAANSIFTICAMAFNGQNLDYIYIYLYWGMVINPSIGFNRKLYTHYGMDDHKPRKTMVTWPWHLTICFRPSCGIKCENRSKLPPRLWWKYQSKQFFLSGCLQYEPAPGTEKRLAQCQVLHLWSGKILHPWQFSLDWCISEQKTRSLNHHQEGKDSTYIIKELSCLVV